MSAQPTSTAAEPGLRLDQFADVVWTGQSYLCADHQQVFASVDGNRWELALAADADLVALAAGNDRVVAIAKGKIFTAGPAPQPEFSPSKIDANEMTAVGVGGGEFVMIEGRDRVHIGTGDGAWKTADLIPNPEAHETRFVHIGYGNGQWVALPGGGGGVFTATDPAGKWRCVPCPGNAGNGRAAGLRFSHHTARAADHSAPV